MRIRVLRTGVGLSVALLAGVASAAPVTVPIAANRDNTLYEDDNGALSSGAATSFYVGRLGPNGAQKIRRGLLRFDTSSIPTNATITSVTLTLHVGSVGSGGGNVINLHRVTKDWGEGPSGVTQGGGGGSLSADNDATWIHRFYSVANPASAPTWTTPGGDFSAVTSATTLATQPVITTAAMAADVQAWVTNPSANFGWALIGDEGTAKSAIQISSREASAAFRPALSVTYDVIPVPEPGAAALLALALPLLNRRRCRATGQ